jgi:flagellar motor switch protein FliG
MSLKKGKRMIKLSETQMRQGIDEAKKVLRDLTVREREKLLGLMQKKYPVMAQRLQSDLFNIFDYLHFNLEARKVFWEKIDWEDLAHFLRGQRLEITKAVLLTLPPSMEEKVERFVKQGPLISLRKIEEAHAKIQDVLYEMWTGRPDYFKSGHSGPASSAM